MNIACFQNHCCGCGECVEVCPVDAISMEENEQGFLYPKVDEHACLDCGLCVKHCSFNTDSYDDKDSHKQKYYAIKHKDSQIRKASRSGGIFTAISDIILEKGGSVYGCQLIDSRVAQHIRATTKEERNAMRGSKYIQSDMRGIFSEVKADLEKGMWVLFSGTPCQVNAVRDFCKGSDCNKLVLIDVVCHGVPSPKVWGDYIDHICKKQKKVLVSADFRDKEKFGWADHRETFYFSDGTDYSDSIFKSLFYDHFILREACFDCPYKTLNRAGDLTIADCWGIAKHYPQFDDNKGVSLVLVNTEQGENLLSKVVEIDSMPVDIEKLLQPALERNWDIPKEYYQFWQHYRHRSFPAIVKKYVSKKPGLVRRAKNKLRRTLKKFIG